MRIKFLERSFKRELFASFVIVSCIPLLITGFSMVYIFKNWVMHNDEKHADQQLKQIEMNLTTFLEQIEDTSDHLLANDLILKGLQETDQLTKNRAYAAFYAETEALRNVSSFSLYDQEGNCQFSIDSQKHPEKMLTYWGLLKRALAKPDQMLFERTSDLQNGNIVFLQGAKAVTNEEDECVGYIVVTISEKNFEDVLRGAYDEQNGIAIMDHFWKTIYCTKNGEQIAETLRKMQLAHKESDEKLKEIDFYMRPLSSIHLLVVIYKYATFTEDFTLKMRYVIGIMTIVSILWCILAVGVVSGFITKPINRLACAMREVENGHLDFRVKSNRRDEIGQLSRSFDRMTEEIDQSIKLQIQQQKQLNESHIALMQSQLNPHFLYNTLDTMKWVAKAHHIPEIVTLAAGLGKILRTSISGEKMIPLSQELHLVEAYIDIQKIRFNGKFSFDMEVTPELEMCMIPKLIIQPIVENAVIHGLKESECGHIFINIYEQEGKMVIDVFDDGCGIDDQTLVLLNAHNQEKLKGHIGFYNVDTIIRLNYGDTYGLKAERQKTGGTKIQMILPINWGNEVEDV